MTGKRKKRRQGSLDDAEENFQDHACHAVNACQAGLMVLGTSGRWIIQSLPQGQVDQQLCATSCQAWIEPDGNQFAVCIKNILTKGYATLSS
jgi:hypothetical protein